MINIDDFEIFKNNLSTLKETSIDNHDGVDSYMTESVLEVINFDKVKDEYIKGMRLHEVPKSNDVLYIGQDGELTFIEFKNGQMIKDKIFNVRLKIFDSLLIFTDIIGQGVNFTRTNMKYILVYNEEKNSPEITKTTVRSSSSRDEIAKKLIEQKGKGKFIRFNLERFKNLYFNDISTYTKHEFEKNFVDKHVINA